jgi:hypothetical protein
VHDRMIEIANDNRFNRNSAASPSISIQPRFSQIGGKVGQRRSKTVDMAVSGDARQLSSAQPTSKR